MANKVSLKDSAFGESLSRSILSSYKLSMSDVITIRELGKKMEYSRVLKQYVRTYSNENLAKRFNVHVSHIQRILRDTRWSNLITE